MAQDTDNIALFPLGIVLLPGEYAELYIFEPRYKQLIHECDQNLIAGFGILSLDDSDVLQYGCLVELREVITHHPTGEMDVLVQAKAIFKLHKFNLQREGKMYPEGEISLMDGVHNAFVSSELRESFRRHMLNQINLNTEMLRSDIGIFDVANELGMADQEKMELIRLRDNAARDRYLINYLRYLNLLEKQQHSVQNDIFLN